MSSQPAFDDDHDHDVHDHLDDSADRDKVESARSEEASHDDSDDHGSRHADEWRDSGPVPPLVSRSVVRDSYAFTIVDGVVVSVSEMDDDGTLNAELPERHEFYKVEGATVVKTEVKVNGQEVTRYALAPDGFYVKESSQWAASVGVRGQKKDVYANKPDTYTFELVDGVVASVTKTDDDGAVKVLVPDVNETYAFDGTDIIKSELHSNGQELTRFVLNSEGVYVKASEQWLPGSAQPGKAAAPVLSTVMDYEGSDLDDTIAVSPTQSATGGAGADQFVIRDAGHLWIDDFSPSDRDQVVFDTGLGLQSVDQLIRYVTDVRTVGQDFVVEFGADISITIVGGVSSGIDWGDVVVLS